MHLPFLGADFFRDFDGVNSQKDGISRSFGLPSNLRSFMRGAFPAKRRGNR